MDEKSYVNPFSIACRQDSDQGTEGEVTAEGFYKSPELYGKPQPSARREIDPADMVKQDSGISGNSRNVSQSGNTPAAAA